MSAQQDIVAHDLLEHFGHQSHRLAHVSDSEVITLGKLGYDHVRCAGPEEETLVMRREDVLRILAEQRSAIEKHVVRELVPGQRLR